MDKVGNLPVRKVVDFDLVDACRHQGAGSVEGAVKFSMYIILRIIYIIQQDMRTHIPRLSLY